MIQAIIGVLVLSILCQGAHVNHPRLNHSRLSNPRLPRLGGRIVGGENAKIEDFPYQVAVLDDGELTCGASIISADWVLTAAHCVEDVEPEYISIRAGSSIASGGGSVHQPAQITIHPKYDYYETDYDYALIKVAKPFKLGQPGIQAIKLANSEPTDGDNAIISGWGDLTEDGPLSSQLQKVEMPIVGRDDCQDVYYDFEITKRMICAGDGSKDSCAGDSGGPLVVNGELSGVISWGVGCAVPMYPGVYANVANQRHWIRKVSGV